MHENERVSAIKRRINQCLGKLESLSIVSEQQIHEYQRRNHARKQREQHIIEMAEQSLLKVASSMNIAKI